MAKRSALDPATREAIERAATENGLDPGWALAIAERENGKFDPRARNSKTIRGIYQMRGDHRAKYGVGDSDDIYTQAKGWGAFFKNEKAIMARKLGRDPTDAEGYLGHHFGAARAARMMKMDPNTPVDQVFTAYERSPKLNPHIDRAGTVGKLNSTILADLDERYGRLSGGKAQESLDLSSFGTPIDTVTEPVTKTVTKSVTTPVTTAAPDFSEFGTPVTPAQQAADLPDFSEYGTPA